MKSSGPWKASLGTKLVEVMEFQLSYFKSWKIMLWKCCTQYASKFGKLSSGHRTTKHQFSFQSLTKAMPKNAQATTQSHSSHTLVKWCLKFSKPGRLQQYINHELPDVQAGFRKGRGTKLTHSEQGGVLVPRPQQGEDTAKETEEGKCQGMLISSRKISFSPFNFLISHMLPPLFFLCISLCLYERC